MTPEHWLRTVDSRAFRRRLLRWFARHGRDFAWRRTTDPYAIWVSEVMLQQTTTATISRRFPQFLEQFPTVEALARAPEEVVLRAWERLGYYRRARNLHRAAQVVVKEHDGVIPADPQLLRTLPGLGRYSANAIVCFVQNRPLPILEANTVRVWSRLCGAKGDATKQPLLEGLWKAAEALIPPRRAREFNLALMDLGAMICTPRSPDCPRCPVNAHCVAFGSGRPERFPLKQARATIIVEEHVVAVVRHQDQYLVVQRGDTPRWAGMWGFPTAELKAGDDAAVVAVGLASSLARLRGRPAPLPQIRHGVTRFRLTVASYLFEGRPRKQEAAEARWATLAELADLPFSSAHRRLVTFLSKLRVSETGEPGGRPGAAKRSATLRKGGG